jgi:transposase-like protein
MKTPNWSELGAYFYDEDKARELLEQMRWPMGPMCPHCGTKDPYKLTWKPGTTMRKGVYKCRAKDCRRQFTVTVKSVFESSHVKMTMWLQAIYLQCASKKGISALQLKRMFGLKSYKTAWFIAHRLRHAMRLEPFKTKLSGVVEADESYFGGKKRMGPNDRFGTKDHKTPVMVLVERGGRVKAMPMERVTSETLGHALREHVDPGATIMTDELPAYRKATAGFKKHRTTNHAAREYARGNVHSNSAEGFFSLLKRGINGTYHHVGKGHLEKYCDEFAFKYTSRRLTDADRAALLVNMSQGKRLLYDEPDRAR